MKYLRHTLWQLQTGLDCAILEADGEFLRLRLGNGLWLDVTEFEGLCTQVQGIPGEELDEAGARRVQEALELYRGNLLDGWYQDWCLFERERLQRMYLAMLEKLMAYCEAHGEYELGVDCGTSALRCEAAHERIHRRLMRLHYLAGDRTAALRQYERCVALLREELDVGPSERTVALHDQIRSGQPRDLHQVPNRGNGLAPQKTPATPHQALHHLKQLELAFVDVGRQLQDIIQIVDAVANDGDSRP